MSRYPAWWLNADGVPQEYLDDWAESRVRDRRGDQTADAETDARDDTRGQE